MGKINDVDYKNALEVIKKCKEYVSNEMGEIMGNDDFTTPKLLVLEEITDYHHRGFARVYLTINYSGLTTCTYCEDGTLWWHDIKTDGSFQYAYNSYSQKTIELALQLAENWRSLKESIAYTKKRYFEVRERHSFILENFEV